MLILICISSWRAGTRALSMILHSRFHCSVWISAYCFCSMYRTQRLEHCLRQQLFSVSVRSRSRSGLYCWKPACSGLPVIATRVGGVPEIIRDEQDGILVDGGDATQLGETIRVLLDAPERAAALGASLHDRVLQEFCWLQAVERYVRLAASL